MDTRLSVALSFQRRDNLSKRQLQFFDALYARIETAGLRVLPESKGSDQLHQRYKTVLDSQGVLAVVFGQWEGRRLNRNRERLWVLPSEVTHMAATMAIAAKKPMLVLREQHVDERGAFRKGSVHPVVDLPKSLDLEWLDSPSFQYEFDKWLAQVRLYKHVFLGYSSQANTVGANICRYLTEKLGVKVFDWHDFRAGDTIWGSIESAERLTTCGIFLFMSDDRFAGDGEQFAPRDNVVYEAGYFAGAKGRSQTLIIRESGAKVPSDLGGILYLTLDDRHDIRPIETRLGEHVLRMISGAVAV